jgi:hypothetical protein
MKLPFVHPSIARAPADTELDRADLLRAAGVRIRPTPRAKVAQGEGHQGPVPSHIPINDNRISKNFFKKGDDVKNTSSEADTDREKFQRTPETEKLFNMAMGALKVDNGHEPNPRLKQRSKQHQEDLAVLAREREAGKTAGGWVSNHARA